ncbi:hypothetical protein PIB30_015102 [Stylosanthes scabra]|uniref:Uncharacterized protein n=1 Tax=Stylosanthes scabra TaxID=79078 RepID=A0ABU6R779_9FABA|nr:hypothetical protein [Stylosanthes scabra]
MGWGFSLRISSDFSGTGSSLESWRSIRKGGWTSSFSKSSSLPLCVYGELGVAIKHYDLLETDGQLKVHCGVLDKKKMESLGLDESRFTTCRKSEFKAYSGHLHKFHHKKAKVGELSLRKHLRPCKFQ